MDIQFWRLDIFALYSLLIHPLRLTFPPFWYYMDNIRCGDGYTLGQFFPGMFISQDSYPLGPLYT